MSLTNATDRLEGAFMEADAKINNLTSKIDATFKATEEGELDGQAARGPAELMQTLVGVREEFNTIVKEVAELQKAQEEMFSTIMQQLQSAQVAADSLKDISGFVPENQPQ